MSYFNPDQQTFTTAVACKECGKTAMLVKECVGPNSVGGATAYCNSCCKSSTYSYTLTNGVFTYLR